MLPSRKQPGAYLNCCQMTEVGFRCGVITVAGKPNVGKSTLVNAIVGIKVSIVTPKPQTTRKRILGIHTTEDAQFIYIDTPGLHLGTKHIINRRMNREASNAIAEANVVLLVVEAGIWRDDDDHALSRCISLERPLVLAVNKIDKLKTRSALLPYLDSVQKKTEFNCIVPISAATRENIEQLESAIKALLPVTPRLYPDTQLTDQEGVLRTAECIREKLMLALDQEVPYSIAVSVDEYKLQDNTLHISAIIWVEREGQKAIVIGLKGSMLKQIGQAARLELEIENKRKVFLRLWVKVREHWTDDNSALNTLGLTD